VQFISNNECFCIQMSVYFEVLEVLHRHVPYEIACSAFAGWRSMVLQQCDFCEKL
jgi:hypothetical protein